MTHKKSKHEDVEHLSGEQLCSEQPCGEQASDHKKKTIMVLEDEYQQMQKQLAESKEKYLRLLAEFENARKRQERERVEFIRYANEALLVDLLNIIDDLERAVVAAKEKHQDYDAFLKGVEMVMKQIADLLKKQGVEAVDPVGKPFDPYAHEILVQGPSADHDDGTVVELFQKGYKMGERIIRTAKVKVAVNLQGQDGEPAQ